MGVCLCPCGLKANGLCCSPTGCGLENGSRASLEHAGYVCTQTHIHCWEGHFHLKWESLVEEISNKQVISKNVMIISQKVTVG